MALTRKELVDAAEDLNVVLKLNPLIATAFESTLKGAALKSVEGKFLEQVKADLIECATLIRETDTLQKSTVDVLETIGVEGIREKVKIFAPDAPTTAPAPSEENRKEELKVSPPIPKRGSNVGKGKKKEVKAEVKTKVKAPVKAKKAPATKKAPDVIEKDSYGFRVKTKSSEAIGLIAAGKMVLKDIRKKFPMLSFGKLIADLENHGFKVKESKEGLTSIAKK